MPRLFDIHNFGFRIFTPKKRATTAQTSTFTILSRAPDLHSGICLTRQAWACSDVTGDGERATDTAMPTPEPFYDSVMSTRLAIN